MANKICFKVPLPVSINQLYEGWTRRKSEKGEQWHEDAGWLAKEAKHKTGFIPIENEKIVMELIFYYKSLKKTRDTHNYHKQLADAFEGILYNNDRYVLMRDIDYRQGDKNEVQVLIYKKEEAEK